MCGGGGGGGGGFACFCDKRAKAWNPDGNNIQRNPVVDPRFSWGVAVTPKVVVLTYYFANFCRKLHETESIWTPEGGASLTSPLDPPMKPILIIYRMEFHQTRLSSASYNRPVVKTLAASLF